MKGKYVLFWFCKIKQSETGNSILKLRLDDLDFSNYSSHTVRKWTDMAFRLHFYGKLKLDKI